MRPRTSGQGDALNCFEGIRAVSLDVGGTLITPWPSVGHVYAEVAAQNGVLQATPALLNHRFDAAWSRRHQPHHTREQWRELVDEVFAGLVQPPPSQTFFPELYDRFAEAGSWRIFDDVRPTLDFLQRRRIPLAVISNWDERLRLLLTTLDLGGCFSVILISCEIGAAKPSPLIFQEAARQLRLPPESILHVGDSDEDDLEGAQAAGFKALRIVRCSTTASSGQITSLEELRRLIRALCPLRGAILGIRTNRPRPTPPCHSLPGPDLRRALSSEPA